MEKTAAPTEFLCLRCGLQGLCEARMPDPSDGLLCPRCGDRAITAQSLAKETAEKELVLV
jgi:DNA-directed RNA polymerase subunit RPC12/RpoP